jgi:hypothetical protein
LGAVVWSLVAVFTQREFGWIAIAVGGAAGGGMAAGCNEKVSGAVPGVIACAMSLGGIVLGKILIIVWVLLPLLTGDIEGFGFKREVLAGQMAHDSLKKQGIDPQKADEALIEKETNIAMQSLEGLSDEEIDQRFQTMIEEAEAKADAEEARRQLAKTEQQTAPGAEGDAPQEGQPQNVADQPQFAEAAIDGDEEEDVSLLAIFIGAMFSPIDGLFILLAFATAYRLGSGSISTT